VSQVEGEEAPAGAGLTVPDVELDLTEAPGVGPKTAEKLVEAGYGRLPALITAGEAELVAVEGVGPGTAAALRRWAAEKAQAASAAEELTTEARAVPAAAESTMGDEDFMAALSRAFQESERQRGTEGAEAEEEAGRGAEE
jgi:NAD-dependent DNA ligase